MKYILILISIIPFLLNAQDCRRPPKFAAKLGFNPSRSALSSTEKHTRGVVLIELGDAKNENSNRQKTHQDPSWKTAGHLGAIATDKNGDSYILTNANVNMLYNPKEDQNNIYKIDTHTGKMSLFVRLPGNGLPNPHNAYGGMSSFYDCDNHQLIVTSLAGSTQFKEIGRIFSVDLATKKVSVLVDNIDAMGIAISNVEGKRKLYFGKARSPKIFSVALDAQNNLISKPRECISLDGLGPRGDDKARRIRFERNGNIKIYGIDFLYNLSAPSVKHETVYRFKFVGGRWTLVGMG